MRGTHRTDRDESPSKPGVPASDILPTAPAWLKNLDALREWHRLLPVLMKNRLLTEGNVSLLIVHAALYGQLVRMLEAGEVPSASLLSVHRRQLSDLGLTGISIPLAAPGRPNPFLVNVRPR